MLADLRRITSPVRLLSEILQSVAYIASNQRGRTMFYVLGFIAADVFIVYFSKFGIDLALWMGGILVDVCLGYETSPGVTVQDHLDDVQAFIAPGWYMLDQWITISILWGFVQIGVAIYLCSVGISWALSLLYNVTSVGVANS